MECIPGRVTLVFKNPNQEPEACAELKSVCQQAADSNLQAAPPVGVCFQSDEPRLDPNSLADLGTLRRQLTAALQIVHTRERALSEALLPRSVEEVEQAETLLSRALEDLKTSKHHIQSQVSGAPSPSLKKTAPKKNSPGK